MAKKLNIIELPVFTYKDGKYYVSEVPFIHVASQGKTIDESIANVTEAVELYFEGEDVEEILKEKVPLKSNVYTSTIAFDKKTKHLVATSSITS
ncbi:MAG: type II toxin-antitoxin system HicB family antitoxin [DPANN group archaeon]|nr:type II toxin-antitoxin system HicB family antitoxin [DPANN group archaeon]